MGVIVGIKPYVCLRFWSSQHCCGRVTLDSFSFFFLLFLFLVFYTQFSERIYNNNLIAFLF